mmetsp:Transcript_65513/g.213318  ORF Transcript_65513/g.213318 Transcript_65513/m.213318 type:complete len:368 (+) Transcript_65513:162-1265(+)
MQLYICARVPRRFLELLEAAPFAGRLERRVGRAAGLRRRSAGAGLGNLLQGHAARPGCGGVRLRALLRGMARKSAGPGRQREPGRRGGVLAAMSLRYARLAPLRRGASGRRERRLAHQFRAAAARRLPLRALLGRPHAGARRGGLHVPVAVGAARGVGLRRAGGLQSRRCGWQTSARLYFSPQPYSINVVGEGAGRGTGHFGVAGTLHGAMDGNISGRRARPGLSAAGSLAVAFATGAVSEISRQRDGDREDFVRRFALHAVGVGGHFWSSCGLHVQRSQNTLGGVPCASEGFVSRRLVRRPRSEVEVVRDIQGRLGRIPRAVHCRAYGVAVDEADVVRAGLGQGQGGAGVVASDGRLSRKAFPPAR